MKHKYVGHNSVQFAITAKELFMLLTKFSEQHCLLLISSFQDAQTTITMKTYNYGQSTMRKNRNAYMVSLGTP